MKHVEQIECEMMIVNVAECLYTSTNLPMSSFWLTHQLQWPSWRARAHVPHQSHPRAVIPLRIPEHTTRDRQRGNHAAVDGQGVSSRCWHALRGLSRVPSTGLVSIGALYESHRVCVAMSVRSHYMQLTYQSGRSLLHADVQHSRCNNIEIAAPVT